MTLGLSRRRSRVRVPSLPSRSTARIPLALAVTRESDDPALIPRLTHFGPVIVEVPEGIDVDAFVREFGDLLDAHDLPWRARRGSLLTPGDHSAMLEGLVAVVEAFELLGAVA